MAENIVVGQTSPITQQLLLDGVPFNAAGMDIELELIGLNGAVVDVDGDVEWEDEATSVAKYTPDTDDFDEALSPYAARWKVTDGAGVVSFFPNADADVWTVRE